MRYPKTTLIAAASSLALLASLALPANATPSFAPIGGASPDLILVKGGGHGGGGGGGGGPHIGGPAGTHFAATGGARFAASPHMGSSFGHNSFGHMGGNNAHIARGSNFSANAGRHERFANNGNWNWNGNRHDHDDHHHHHFNRFYAYPYFYGGYYAYNYGYGDCGWLYRRAVASGSPYWWNRYYACVY